MPDSREFTLEQVTGQARSHLAPLAGARCDLHLEVIAPFLAMQAAAAAEGIDLQPFSGFRDFERQLAIWNGKFRGERPMQDRAGRPLEVTRLSGTERVEAIFWWSALPGASRHHWGTDLDVLDAAALPPGYRLQAVPAEYAPGGPFHRLTAWLDAHMHVFGFYRPYTVDRGGVLPEPWHLSYAPVARRAQGALSAVRLRDVLAAAAIEGKTEVLAALDRYWSGYLLNVEDAPEEALLSPRLS
jgi:LAS superfamily LD-carboxypeptidase LdcB